MKQQVDFFVVGQPKSGTTALSSFLDEHPDVCITVPKEPCYMATDLIRESDALHGGKRFHVRTPAEYAATFSHARDDQLVGDASTLYLYSKCAASEIKRHNPDAKIIIMLRNPVDMLCSLYHQHVNQAIETAASFREALTLETKCVAGHRGTGSRPSYLLYRERGKHHAQVVRYFREFDARDILVLVSEDFRSDNAGTYSRVLRFLGVDDAFKPNFRGIHERRSARSALILRLAHLHRVKQSFRFLLGEQRYARLQKRVVEPLLFKRTEGEALDVNLRRELEAYFEDDVSQLSDLLGRDLRALWFGKRA